VLGERLLGSFERIIEGAGGGDGAGEIRERDAEVAIFVSVDQGNVKRWSCFLRQAAKVDSAMKRVIHHEDAETVFG